MPCMSSARVPISLFDRLRSAAWLRVLALCAALLASQNVIACALEETWSAESIELVAEQPPTGETSTSGCCALCTDCAHSGGCCGIAVSHRSASERFALARLHDKRPGTAATAPASWKPPTLLRPPIVAA